MCPVYVIGKHFSSCILSVAVDRLEGVSDGMVDLPRRVQAGAKDDSYGVLPTFTPPPLREISRQPMQRASLSNFASDVSIRRRTEICSGGHPGFEIIRRTQVAEISLQLAID